MVKANRAFLLRALLGTSALAVLQSQAMAGGFALREQSAYGQGSSFAGIAAGGSLSSMFWNPATLAAVSGLEIEAVGTLLIPTSDVDITSPLTSDEGDIAEDAFLPALYGAYRLNDRFTLGIGVNSGYGLVTRYDSTSILRTSGVAGTSDIFSINVNPAVSFQVNDWLALALGAQVQFIDVRLTGLPPALGLDSVEGDDIAVGATAGILLTPMAGTEIGLGYRSHIDQTLEGELETLLGDFDVEGEGLDLPDVITLGVRQRITDRFRVMAGAEWANWSRFEAVDITGQTFPSDIITLDFDYNDGWFFSAGGEYDVNDKLTVRAGIGYELSPLDDDNRTFRLPDNDRLWLSAGASYKASERFSFDLGYTYISVADTDIVSAVAGGPTQNGPFSGESDADVHLISAALKVKFGGGPKAFDKP
jgi:long-chain fatty acid transport protein